MTSWPTARCSLGEGGVREVRAESRVAPIDSLGLTRDAYLVFWYTTNKERHEKEGKDFCSGSLAPHDGHVGSTTVRAPNGPLEHLSIQNLDLWHEKNKDVQGRQRASGSLT